MDKIRYYKILNTFQIGVTILGSTYRVVRLAKTHQDLTLAWFQGIVYGILDELRAAMEEVL